jgi:hypothetical protein
MTTEGRTAYQIDLQDYSGQAKEYERHSSDLQKLNSYVLSTVSTTYKKTCCIEGETLDIWYEGFQRIGWAYEDNRIPDARARYQRAIKPLSRLPRTFDVWITEWETAMTEGKELQLGDIKPAQYWVTDLMNALRTALPSWRLGLIASRSPTRKTSRKIWWITEKWPRTFDADG